MTWAAENIGTLALIVAALVWVFIYHTTRRELDRSYRAFDELVKDTPTLSMGSKSDASIAPGSQSAVGHRLLLRHCEHEWTRKIVIGITVTEVT